MHGTISYAFCDAWPLLMGPQGELRIAHCGGVHVGLNSLIKALNFAARLLGHPFRWRAPPTAWHALLPDLLCNKCCIGFF